jgi:hypothetical protein
MPFSMKNTRATYQWMVNKVFKHQIGKNMKTYMNDLLVKSITFKQHMRDSKEIFFVLSSYQMKLNQAKYVFIINEENF